MLNYAQWNFKRHHWSKFFMMLMLPLLKSYPVSIFLFTPIVWTLIHSTFFCVPKIEFFIFSSSIFDYFFAELFGFFGFFCMGFIWLYSCYSIPKIWGLWELDKCYSLYLSNYSWNASDDQFLSLLTSSNKDFLIS